MQLYLSRRGGGDPNLSAGTGVLTFTPATWNNPKAVVIAAGEDANSGSGSAVFEFTAHSDDAGYDRLEVPVLVAVEEDGFARAGVNISRRLLSVGRGEAAVYTIALNSRPRGDVTVELVRKSGAGAVTADFGTPGLSSMTFTRNTWNQPRQVVVRRAEDGGEVTFTHHLSSDDDRYDSLGGGGFSDVTVRAREAAAAAHGVTLSRLGAQAEGGTAGWTVVLDSPPSAPVRIAVEKAAGAATLSAVPALLTFTGDTWNLPQAVTVQGAGSGGSTWGHWVSSADPAYDGLVLYAALTDALTDTDAVAVRDEDDSLSWEFAGAALAGVGVAAGAAVLIGGSGESEGGNSPRDDENENEEEDQDDREGGDPPSQPAPPDPLPVLPSPPPAGGATLSALSLSSLSGIPVNISPAFEAGTTEYMVDIPPDVFSLMVMATATDATNATVTITPEDVGGGEEHQVEAGLGRTEITVTVANGGDTQAYTISVVRSGLLWQETATVGAPSEGRFAIFEMCGTDGTGGTDGIDCMFTVPGTGTERDVQTVVWNSTDLSLHLYLSPITNSLPADYEKWDLIVGSTMVALSDNSRIGIASGETGLSIQFDDFFENEAARPGEDDMVTVSLAFPHPASSGSARGASAPAGFSVSDAEAHEDAGAELAFNVSLDQGLETEARVAVSTRDGSAKAGADYRAVSETLIFAPGETEKTVRVPVLNDSHDEDREEMTLVLSDPTGAAIADGEGTGAIVNADAIPKAWIARFGRTVTSQVLDAVEARVSASRQTGWRATLAGQALPSWNGEEGENRASRETLRDWFDRGPEPGIEGIGFSRRSRGVTERELLAGTSFALTTRADPGDHFSVWGRGSVAGFDGREDGLNLDGRVTTGLVGADWVTDGWMAGMAVGHSIGTGGYRRGNCASGGCGSIEADLTGLYPYAGLELSERITAWAAAGYGSGELTVTADGAEAITTDLTMGMGAVGLRGEVLAPERDEGLSLAVTSDARVTQTSSEAVRGPGGNLAEAVANVWTGRAGIEGARRFGFGSEADGASLTPSFEIGVRLDGGDAEQGLGADIGGGLALADPKRGLSLDLSGRGLLIHEAEGFREWGAGAALAWDPQPTTDRGLSLSLGQSWGASPAGKLDALLGPDTFAGFVNTRGVGGSDRFEAAGRLDGEVGYGVPMFGDDFTGTFNAGFGLSAGDRRDYRIGWRLTPAGPHQPDLEVGLDATRREVANDDAGHGVALRGTIRW